MMKPLKWFYRGVPTSSFCGASDRITQSLRFELAVLKHVGKHRQMTTASTEAGGQLFGRVSEEEVRVLSATGPYHGDERSRYLYRSNPRAAQRAVAKHAKGGLLYLGEWHTHAEDYPITSKLDMNVMRRLLARSKLNVNALLMLIVGRRGGLDGLALCSVGSPEVNQWKLYQED